MEHQDWTTVVLNKKNAKIIKSENTEKVINSYASKNTQKSVATPAYKIEEKVDGDDYQMPTISHKLQMQIQQARQAKKMTQKQFAQACNMQQTIIRDYENGSIIPNQKDILKMSKVLGIVIKK